MNRKTGVSHKKRQAPPSVHHFVFAFIGECCTRPHLYGITKSGVTRADALKKAKREVMENNREVSEFIEVGSLIGSVEEV